MLILLCTETGASHEFLQIFLSSRFQASYPVLPHPREFGGCVCGAWGGVFIRCGIEHRHLSFQKREVLVYRRFLKNNLVYKRRHDSCFKVHENSLLYVLRNETDDKKYGKQEFPKRDERRILSNTPSEIMYLVVKYILFARFTSFCV